MCEVLDRVEAKGKAEGESNFVTLVSALLAANRVQDIKRATDDAACRKKLYKEFGITY